MLSATQLLENLLDRARGVTETETVAIAAALGRVLAVPQTSSIAVPPLDNSAMDGYAVRLADMAQAGVRLRVSQRILAGAVGAALLPGTAARIFTGAPVPLGADAVLMQEDCTADGEDVLVNTLPRPGENIRRAGEDIEAGAQILATGARLGAAEMGLLASVGLAEVPVFKKLKVACFFTGDELATPGAPLAPGQIYNSNRYTLTGLVNDLGCELIDLGIVPDTLEATEAALTCAAREADRDGAERQREERQTAAPEGCGGIGFFDDQSTHGLEGPYSLPLICSGASGQRPVGDFDSGRAPQVPRGFARVVGC
ncbi:MAG: hypothetical protein B7X94_03420, partial [Hydrogenophilales bacterium 17-62-8]